MTMSKRDDIPGPRLPKEYYLRPFLRYVFLLAAVAFFFLLVPMIVSAIRDTPRFGTAMALSVWAFLVFAVLSVFFILFLALSTKVRIDEQGVHVRSFLFRSFWPWEHFRSGRVHKRFGHFYYEQPAGRAEKELLGFFQLSQRDAQEVLDVCRSRWVRPVRAFMPSDVTIRYRKGTIRSTRLRFFSGGIDKQKGKTKQHYSWEDVQHIEIVRYEYDDEDFRKLSLDLGGERVRLLVKSRAGLLGRIWWSGAGPEEILSVIHEFAHAEKVTDLSIAGRPRDMEDLENRRAYFERWDKGSTKGTGCVAFFFVFLWALLVVVPILLGERSPSRFKSAAGLSFLLLGTVVLLYWLPWHLRRGRQRWSARWREELEGREENLNQQTERENRV